MLTFVPVYAGIMLAGGSAAASAGSQTMVFGAAQLIARASDALLVPAAGGLMSLSAVADVYKRQQMAHCGMHRREFERLLGEARSQEQVKARLYRSLSLLAGAAVIILAV